jgi:5-methylthioribose kinase
MIDRDEILRAFRDRITGGTGILGVSAGSGIAARHATLAGADFLAVYSSGWFRTAGYASVASMLPLGNANDLTLSLASEILPQASGVPVIAGLCAWDVTAPLAFRLDECARLGIAGIQNFPSSRLYPEAFRADLERAGFGLDQELALISLARSRGMLSFAFAFDSMEAAAMAAAGADVIAVHLGITNDALADDDVHEAAGASIRSMAASARRMKPDAIILVHGGPVARPEDVSRHRRLVPGLDGFIAASSVERTPVACAIRDATAALIASLTTSAGSLDDGARWAKPFDVGDGAGPEPTLEIDESNVASYLRDHGLVKADERVEVKPLGGGISNQILRFDTADAHGVLKQSRSRIRVAQDWRCDVRRILNERDSIRLLGGLLAPGTVPGILFEDPENYLFIMTPAPAESTLWKSDLMNGFVDPIATDRAGRTLRRIHARTWGDPDVRERFDNDDLLRQLRIEPYYEATASAHPQLAGAIVAGAEQILATKKSLVHGDFVPKNIFTTTDGLLLLDHEIAHFGDPAYDTASCINHLLLKAIHFSRRTDARPYLYAATQFWRAYRADGGDEACADESHTVQQLGCLVLARVDGKSPVEYLDEAERDIARRFGASLLKERRPGLLAAISDLGAQLVRLARVEHGGT